jgi:3-deoxy-manno-octulosonate cytidylyltransferase (CMP-KDO synthetase)
MIRVVAIVPARMASSRFPGKPLAPILGRPMIEHVVHRATMCERLDALHIATCDDEIRIVAEACGVSAIMTSPAHQRASDRVAEAAEQLDADIVVMIQGDEPMIHPSMIDEALRPMLDDSSIGCVNLARRIVRHEDHVDPNTIKVVTNSVGDALYFSRAPIPCADLTSHSHRPPVLKQVCVIPFRRDFLRDFARLEPTPLECTESIDMLRALEHGRRVRIVETFFDTHAVDTPDDLRLVERLMRDDPVLGRYGRLVSREVVSA